jgi:pimeloyl-ACP methyl ester carboxylesterase
MNDTQAAELFRQPPDRYLDVSGDGTAEGEVAYRVVGQGPDVLFVHGWPVNSATYRKLLPHLADHVTCHLIDLVGTGDSKFDANTTTTIDNHVATVRRVVDLLGFDRYGAVGHDSGGMVARHAMAGDDRLAGMALINTEQSRGLSTRFKLFLNGRNLPGFGATLGWLAGKPMLRRNKFVLGDAFVDRSLLDGEFDEFFLQPLNRRGDILDAAMKLLRSFDPDRHVATLESTHRRIDCPVRLIWGDQDPFFPLSWTEEMVSEFAKAELHVVEGGGLFCHEERPKAVADALLPVLTGG